MEREERKRVGLALGGGVVRGMAHIGVLSVLEENGIPIDFVAGTSAGSVIAVTYASGLSARQIREYALDFHWWRIARPVFPVRGFVSFDKLAHWMIMELGDLDFADLKIPCTVVATDLENGTPRELSEGRVAPAVQASCSVPGIVTPVELDGHLLCDGGVSDMIPVSALRRMGAEYVVAVDIFPFVLRRYLGPLGYLMAALEVLLERAGGGIDEADCLIVPDLRGKTYMRFSKREELYEIGRQATFEKLKHLQRDLGLPPRNSIHLEEVFS